MSRRHFDSTENAELRAKIDEAKRRLPMPKLMRRMGFLEKHIGESAHCPFHDDTHKSFSVFHSKNGKGWQWKCHAGCGHGDEIAFLVKALNISRREAICRYLDMADFPAECSTSREYPEFPKSLGSRESLNIPESPEFPVYPVSEGQTVAVHGVVGKLHTELKAFAARNACTGSTRPEKSSWQLARDLKAVAKRIGRKLSVAELMLTFYEWHRLSHAFLDPGKSRDHYWMEFLAQLQKVRIPTGEGTILDALQHVSKLMEPELPVIPGYGNGSKSRKIAALHRELSRRSTNKDKKYFLSYRDAARVCDGLSHQDAHTITLALASVGVIEIVSKGKSGLNSGEAAEFRYLLSQSENGAEDDDAGFEI
jgi:hypothetical protein